MLGERLFRLLKYNIFNNTGNLTQITHKAYFSLKQTSRFITFVLSDRARWAEPMNYKAALTLYSPPFRLAHLYLNNTFIVSQNVTNCKKKSHLNWFLDGWSYMIVMLNLSWQALTAPLLGPASSKPQKRIGGPEQKNSQSQSRLSAYSITWLQPQPVQTQFAWSWLRSAARIFAVNTPVHFQNFVFWHSFCCCAGK